MPREPIPPRDLIATREEARLCILGVGVFAAGALAFFVLELGRLPQLLTVVMSFVSVPFGIVGYLLLYRISRRLRPQKLGPFQRWRFDSQVGGEMFTPRAIRRAFALMGRER